MTKTFTIEAMMEDARQIRIRHSQGALQQFCVGGPEDKNQMRRDMIQRCLKMAVAPMLVKDICTEVIGGETYVRKDIKLMVEEGSVEKIPVRPPFGRPCFAYQISRSKA